MKRTERRHLKENELKKWMREARELFDESRQQAWWAIALVVLVAAGVLGYVGWRQHVRTSAGALLADALTVQEARIGPPPAPGTVNPAPYFPTERERSQAALVKFKAAADAYPSTDTGLFARYQQATTTMTLGNPTDAATIYQQVIDSWPSSLYAQMARLGLAETQARAGQFDQAINAFKELSQRKDGPLPVDGILMQLGRTYIEAGKPNDAQQTFTRLIEEFPDSPFSQDAKRELDSLKKT
ncbi:MAG: tetratricopeptide repeat protein [Acidobacteria bacterium]|nr:tetratricopeptide repeat protein [Acidobacteriota bacterium]